MGVVNAVWDVIGRTVVWLVWSPVDRAVCRFAEVTHHGRQA